MKALKNNSIVYVEQIEQAVADCYAKNAEPSNAELMWLYSVVGRCICSQGEKAFVVHLAEILLVRFPEIKGFSPRNLRRMRDFYRTYKNDPELMHKAQMLGWTQNAIILECCKNNEQREFYIDLAIDKNMSKLSLIREIEADVFEEIFQHKDDVTQSADEMSAPVSDASGNPGEDKTPVRNRACGPRVAACEPLRQGDGTPSHTRTNNLGIDRRNRVVNDRGNKSITRLIEMSRSPCPPERPSNIWDGLVSLNSALTFKRFRIGAWIGSSPPDRWRYLWKTADWTLQPT